MLVDLRWEILQIFPPHKKLPVIIFWLPSLYHILPSSNSSPWFCVRVLPLAWPKERFLFLSSNISKPRWLSELRIRLQCRRGRRLGGDAGLIPGSGRSPGGGHGKLLQYSRLENPMDGRVWLATVHGVAKQRTRLSVKFLSH